MAMKILTIGFSKAVYIYENVRDEAVRRGHTFESRSVRSVNSSMGSENVQFRAAELDMSEFDLIHVGSLERNRWSTMTALGYLRKNHNCTIVDGRLVNTYQDELSALNRYLLQHENGIRFPFSVSFKDTGSIADLLPSLQFPVVVKTSDSKKGRGVYLAKDFDAVCDFVKEQNLRDPNIGFILREFIPNDGDFRVNVIDGRAIGTLKRTPQKGEFRANASLGGTMTNASDAERAIVDDVAVKIAGLGKYDIAGVDVMIHKHTCQPYILEVNRAPGALEEDAEITGVDFAKLIVDLYEKRFEANQK